MLAAASLIALAACRDEEPFLEFPEPTVTLSGVVTLLGTAPARTPIDMSSDSVCAAAYPSPPLSEDVLVDEFNKLQNAFVYVDMPADRFFPAPYQSVDMQLLNCRFTPRIFGIVPDQVLHIRNGDRTVHDVHAVWDEGEFDLMLGEFSSALAVFPRPQVMVPIRSDTHPWMRAWAGVLRHPWFAVSNLHGRFTIRKLPLGTYTVVAWHERFGTISQQVVVDGEKSIELTFDVRARAAVAPSH